MRKLALPSLLLAVAMALVALAPAAHLSPADAVSVRAEDDVEAGPCDPSLPLLAENGCDDADSLPDIDTVLSALTPLVGANRLAGYWIDRDVSPSVQRIALTGFTPADQVLLDSVTGANSRVKAVAAQFSTDTLNSLVKSLTNTLSALNPELFNISIDVQQDRIDIVVANQVLAATVNTLVGTLLTTLGLPASILNVTTGWSTPSIAASRDTIPPHAGGLNLSTVPNGGGTTELCTTGYTVKSDGGAIMGVTAGHCATGYLADEVSVGGHYLSHSGRNSFLDAGPVNSDAMRYSIPDNYLGTRANYTRIFTNGSGTASSPTYRKLVSPTYTLTNLQVNTKICFQGRTSGANNCGLVTKTNIPSVTYGGQTVNHMWQVKYPAAPGDSGGPAYHVNTDGRARPAGIVDAVGKVNNVPTYMYMSHLQYVMADIDVTMIFP